MEAFELSCQSCSYIWYKWDAEMDEEEARLVEHCSRERNRRCMTGKVHFICELVATNVRTRLQPQIRRWASSHKSRLWPPLTLAYRYAGSQIGRLTVTGEGENQYSWDPLIWDYQIEIEGMWGDNTWNAREWSQPIAKRKIYRFTQVATEIYWGQH